MKLAVHAELGRPLRFRWLTKYLGEDWTWNVPWRDTADFEFKPDRPGWYDIQVDLAERGHAIPDMQKWLGTIEVQGSLVSGIAYSPSSIVVPVETPIRFAVRTKRGIALERLEFRLWELLPTNRVVADWQPWPLPDFHAARPGRTALQVDIRLNDARSIIDQRWLNEFTFDDAYRPLQPNLLRNLLAGDFDVVGREAELGAVAEALWIATHLLLWEFEGISLEEQGGLLSKLSAVASYSPVSAEVAAVTTPGGRRFEIDLRRRLLQPSGSGLQVSVSLKDESAYRTVFQSLRGRQERILAAIMYAVYCGYHYGTPAAVFMDDLNGGVAHCADRALLLREILSRTGEQAEFVEINCGDSGHMLIQARADGDERLLLDPTSARIYRFDARLLGKQPIPDPIILPEVYHIEFLDLRHQFGPSCTSRVFRSARPAVFPLAPDEVSSGAGQAISAQNTSPIVSGGNADPPR